MATAAVVTMAACSGGSARRAGPPGGAAATAATDGPSTTRLATPTAPAPTTVPTTVRATVSPTTTTTLSPTTTTVPIEQRLAAAISRRAGYALTADDALCTAAALTPAAIDAIDADATSGADDPGTDVTAALGAALARCEPAAFVASTAALVTEQWGVTAGQATCVTHAVDQVAATSPAVAAVVLSNWGDLAAGDERDALIGAVATCVDPDLAVTILGG